MNFRGWFVSALAAICIATPLPLHAGGDGTIRGVVSAGGVGQVGVAIEIYLGSGKSSGGTPFAVTESGEGGRFELPLPAGRYYLWARGKPPAFGPPLVSEYAANPVTVEAGKVAVLQAFVLREAGRESMPAAPPQTGIRGRAVLSGSPAADVAVTVYTGEATRLIGPGYAASVTSGTDGAFQTDLPPGTYRVAARRRIAGATAGFLQPGDLTGESPRNPVTVKAGTYTDIGDLALHVVDPRLLAEKEKDQRRGSSPTGLAGIVIGPAGTPLPGQNIFVYQDQGMIGRPTLMAVSSKDGSFSIALPGGGTWYLGARSTKGGPRQPGEMAGRLTGTPDSSVTVRAGESKGGLVIVVEEVW